MGFDLALSQRIREYLAKGSATEVAEKKMFRGITFMVNDKMCVGVSGEKLMCRFDPELQNDAAGRSGFEPMIMKGRVLKGYCYVGSAGFSDERDFAWWLNLCLRFNDRAKASKARRPVRREGGTG